MAESENMISIPVRGRHNRYWLNAGISNNGYRFVGIQDNYTGKWIRMSVYGLKAAYEKLLEVSDSPIEPVNEDVIHAPYSPSKRKKERRGGKYKEDPWNRSKWTRERYREEQERKKQEESQTWEKQQDKEAERGKDYSVPKTRSENNQL